MDHKPADTYRSDRMHILANTCIRWAQNKNRLSSLVRKKAGKYCRLVRSLFKLKKLGSLLSKITCCEYLHHICIHWVQCIFLFHMMDCKRVGICVRYRLQTHNPLYSCRYQLRCIRHWHNLAYTAADRCERFYCLGHKTFYFYHFANF